MKKMFVSLIAIAVPVAAYAQGQSLAATMEVYVFPSSGQESSQQSNSMCLEAKEYMVKY